MRWMALCLVVCAVVVGGCSSTAELAGAGARSHVDQSTGGMVVSNSSDASEIGAAILGRGGNAVDAAIAVQFAMAVTWPEAGNIGGGGFMLVAQPGMDAVCIDYREVAPGAATVDMYAFGENRHHHRHVGVPGTVAGMAMAHGRYGRLPWRELVLPAMALARDGFEVDGHLAASLNRVLNDPKTKAADNLAELRRVYGKPGGGDWVDGDVMVLPDLAGTLEVIAEMGAMGFYRGEVAEQLAASMRRHGGLITEDDLALYQAKARLGVRTSYRGYDVYGAPPASSGGITIGLMLNVLETFEVGAMDRFGGELVHLMAETMKRGFRDRAAYLGDTDFVEVPMERLTSKLYAHELAAGIGPMATSSESLAPPIALADEGPSTTHFSVIDAEGMAVSNTTTLEQAWGSRVIPEGLGFVLNNEMGDFNWKPGYTDRRGRIGTEANVIAPGKRMLSSMSPTIVKKDGEAVLVIGSPGGRTIINTVLGIVVSTVDHGMPLWEAIDAPRMHHAWFPDRITLEEGYEAEVIEALEAKGHEVRVREGSQGAAHGIAIDPETGLRTGVADYRRGGLAVGVE
ncbi:gamma-glutamyltransferase [Mucisphaera sp.]|uniref:gamma-glutamyltransferase n=1 Tax=Mucisphaera sp. TaxID=2913024 RepID=UPI003D1101CB